MTDNVTEGDSNAAQHDVKFKGQRRTILFVLKQREQFGTLDQQKEFTRDILQMMEDIRSGIAASSLPEIKNEVEAQINERRPQIDGALSALCTMDAGDNRSRIMELMRDDVRNIMQEGIISAVIGKAAQR